MLSWKKMIGRIVERYASDGWLEQLGGEPGLVHFTSEEVQSLMVIEGSGPIKLKRLLEELGWRGYRASDSKTYVKSYFFASEAIRLAGSEERVRQIFAAGDDQRLAELEPIIDSFRGLTLEQPTVGGLKAALPQVTRALKLDSLS